ncbi:MAG: primosomal protein N', partial [Steroidobacteraceae bacterium]
MPVTRPQPGILRVALDVPVRRLFDYLSPEAIPGAIRVGARLKVPFGRRRLIGIVVETAPESDIPQDRLKSAVETVDTVPILDAETLALVCWAADYYHHPLGEALASALPRALRLGAPAVRREQRWMATPEGVEALRRGEPRRAPRQRQ